VPREREALERLPGVGRKTANVVLNIAFKQPVIAVDTHIFRVANRTGLAPARPPTLSRSPGKGRARSLQIPRPPLADPAWPLCVRCAKNPGALSASSPTFAGLRAKPKAWLRDSCDLIAG